VQTSNSYCCTLLTAYTNCHGLRHLGIVGCHPESVTVNKDGCMFSNWCYFRK